jgi:hypothetical protein
MIYADGEDAQLIEGLAAATGLDPETTLRQALAVYGYLLGARSQGATFLVRQPNGEVVEVLINLVEPDGSSSGTL